MASKKSQFPKTVKWGNVAVKIYQILSKDGRIFYQIPRYDSGRRRVETLSDSKRALKRAEEIAIKLAEGEADTLSLTKADRAAYRRAQQLIEGTGKPLEVVCAEFAEAHEVTGGRVLEAAREFRARHDRVTDQLVLSEGVARFIEAKEREGLSSRYLGDLRQRLGRFEMSAPNRLIDQITTPDIQLWLDSLKVGNQTTLHYRRVLNTFFEFAFSRGWCSENPTTGVRKLTVRRGDIEIFKPEELEKVIYAAPDEFVAAIAIGAFAGLRPSEVSRLEWDEIDLVRGFIRLARTKGKTASRRIVPIHDNLRAWLESVKASGGRVWPYETGHLSKALPSIGRKVGVGWPHDVLRHSYGSYRLAECQDLAKVALEMGHKNASTTLEHYRELVAPDEAADWFSIKPN